MSYSLFCTSGPSDEPGARVALVQGCDPARQSAYRHRHTGTLEVRVMRHDPRGFRWPVFSGNKKSSFLVDGLIIEADFSLTGGKQMENFRAGFETLGHDHRVTADEAAQMHRTLHRVKKAVETYQRRGGVIEFLEYARAALKSMGIVDWYGYTDDTDRGDLEIPENFTLLAHTRAMMEHVEGIRAYIQKP